MNLPSNSARGACTVFICIIAKLLHDASVIMQLLLCITADQVSVLHSVQK